MAVVSLKLSSRDALLQFAEIGDQLPQSMTTGEFGEDPDYSQIAHSKRPFLYCDHACQITSTVAGDFDV